MSSNSSIKLKLLLLLKLQGETRIIINLINPIGNSIVSANWTINLVIKPKMTRLNLEKFIKLLGITHQRKKSSFAK